MTAFNFSLAALNGTTLVGLRSASLDRRESQSPIGTDGTLHQTGNGVIRAAPMAQLTTIAVRSLFGVLGTGDEVPFVALNGSTGLVMYGPKINASGPGYDSGSTHKTCTALNGMMLLDRVSWSPGQVAEASASVYITSTAGGTDPITVSTAAMPTLPVNTEQMVLSTCTINGTAVSRVASLEVSIGHRAENNDEGVCYNQGLPYPVLLTQAGVAGQTEISATIDTLDLTTAFANGTVVIAFTAISALGVGLGSNTATITINGVLAREQTINGENGAPARRQLLIRGTFDGTNKPLTIATA